MAIDKRRGLTREFMDDLKIKKGLLRPIMDRVQTDVTLSLNIRHNSVNIYYRGGNLLRITQRRSHEYEFYFDDNYAKGRLLPVRPQKVETPVKVQQWMDTLPHLKWEMDWSLTLEREFVQVIERVNNSNRATDYYICDMEYTHASCRNLRADLIALHWPYKRRGRTLSDNPRLAFIEVKFGEKALTSRSGVDAHVHGLISAINNQSNLKYLDDLAKEMLNVFIQKQELGLVSSAPEPSAIDWRHPEYIMVLADQHPHSTTLKTELTKLLQLPAVQLPFHNQEILVARANPMGFGLYDSTMASLSDFVNSL